MICLAGLGLFQATKVGWKKEWGYQASHKTDLVQCVADSLLQLAFCFCSLVHHRKLPSMEFISFSTTPTAVFTLVT